MRAGGEFKHAICPQTTHLGKLAAKIAWFPGLRLAYGRRRPIASPPINLSGAAMPFRFSVYSALFAMLLLSGCDRLGIADPVREAASKEADARATGSACRHAGRAIEDCYAINPDASRAAVYSGWKEMNDYMRENKIEVVKPELAAAAPPPKPAVEADASASAVSGASASASASVDAKPAKAPKKSAAH